MVAPVGFEPTTYWMSTSCSTTELRCYAAGYQPSEFSHTRILVRVARRANAALSITGPCCKLNMGLFFQLEKENFGAGDEARTHDSQIGNLGLYQLSYTRKSTIEV